MVAKEQTNKQNQKDDKNNGAQTRKERRKIKEKQKDEKLLQKRFIRVRMFPIWVRILLFLLLIAGSLALGLMVGYGVLGGGNPKDVFEKSTWQHIIDLVKSTK